MGLEKVVDDILKRGQAKRESIIKTGESERDSQIAHAKKEIEEDRTRAEAKTKTMIAQMEQQDLSAAELESKRALLEAQRQVMDDLRAKVLEELSSMPADKKKKIYSKLVAKARKELEECYVYSNDKDKALLQLPSGMSRAGTIEASGGLVFESRDRRVRLDFRFETILEDMWNEKMKEIYSRLFG